MLGAIDQSALFTALDDGRHALQTSKRRLARHLDIAPGSLTRRLATLVDAGLAVDGDALVVDTDAIRQFLGQPLARPSEAIALDEPLVATQAAPRPAPVDACKAALDSLGRLAQIAADTGDKDLGQVAACCIRSVSSLMLGPAPVRAFEGDSDANAVPNARTSVGNASPNARTSYVVNDNDDDNDSSHSHQRDANAVPNARTPNARTPEAVPVAERGFDGDPDWSVDDVDEVVVTPIVAAYAEATGRHTSVDTDWFLDDLMAWPRAWVERAVGILVDQVQRGRGIINPGGVFAKAVTEGRTEYFPLDEPAKVTVGGAARSWARVNGLRAAGRSRLAAVGEGAISEFENRVWADCGSRLTGLPDTQAREVWLAAWRQRLDASDPPLADGSPPLAEDADPVVRAPGPAAHPAPEEQRLVGPKIGSVLRRRGVPQRQVTEVGRAGDAAVQVGRSRDSVVASILAAVEAVPDGADADQVVEASLRAARSGGSPGRRLATVETPG